LKSFIEFILLAKVCRYPQRNESFNGHPLRKEPTITAKWRFPVLRLLNGPVT
jgi:hypothetical protein